MNIPESSWLNVAAEHVLTPTSDRMAPVSVLRTEGRVETADALLGQNGKSCRLTFEKGGPKPVVILDFGKRSVGGYAVFSVTAKTGQPVVRLAYACHPNGISETGCFARESSARYLGPTFDLPVLPANINRHECYTISRTGRFIAPLIQGQTRYVRVQLDTEGTSVDIDSLIMVNSQVHDRSPHEGFFLCSDERLNRLWYISTWTLQMASFPNHDAWKTVDGWVLPRKLEEASDVGLSIRGAAWSDVTLETRFEIRSNPHHVSAAGIAFRAQDSRNAYLLELALDGAFKLIRRQDGKDTVISAKTLATPLTDGVQYNLVIAARGAVLTTKLDGVVIDETSDSALATGRVGFYSVKEKWPLYDYVRVTDGQGNVLLSDDFSGELTQWDFPRTLSYVSDGGKRDRLIWSGDLYWAERNVFYAWANPSYMRDSVKMLAFNQTPEGYVNASPYPERSVAPVSGEYGPFPSDEFAAWLVPVAWDYLLFTDDVETLRGAYPAIKRLIGYLRNHMGANGLFVQRAETSKHACDLNPGDIRTRAYMNVLLWGTFSDAARIAERLGQADDAADYQGYADALKPAVFKYLWDETQGCFREAVETPTCGFEANALALSMKMVTAEQALRIAPLLKMNGHGKFQSLASRGKFEYGFSQTALQALFDHNWLKLLSEDWSGASTTTECMGMTTGSWGDESHPDTAIAAQFSSYILGVCPVEPGYRRFVVQPQPVKEVSWARGLVPTPHGPISAGWELTGALLKVDLTVPAGTLADVVLPKCARVQVNGKAGAVRNLSAGRYVIEACELAADALIDPTLGAALAAKAQERSLTSSSSCEADGFGLATLFAPESEIEKRGYRSAAHSSAKGSEWIEIDLGAEVTLAQLILVPGRAAGAEGKPGAGFPKDFTIQFAKEPGKFVTEKTFKDCPVPEAAGLVIDFYTVISYPVARFIRVNATQLREGVGSADSNYCLQFARLKIVTPEELRESKS